MVEMCSSDVPGGVSTMRKSRSPQATSATNCLIKATEIEGRKKTTHKMLQQVPWGDRSLVAPQVTRAWSYLSAPQVLCSAHPSDLNPLLQTRSLVPPRNDLSRRAWPQWEPAALPGDFPEGSSQGKSWSPVGSSSTCWRVLTRFLTLDEPGSRRSQQHLLEAPQKAGRQPEGAEAKPYHFSWVLSTPQHHLVSPAGSQWT